MGGVDKKIKQVVSNPVKALVSNPFGGVIGQSVTFAKDVVPAAAKLVGGLVEAPKAPSNPYNVSGDESALTAQFMAKAQGNGPFLADKKMEQDMAGSQAQAMSLASSMRGVSPAAAARMAFSSAGQQNAQIGSQAALNRATEQQQAEMNAFRALESQRQGAQAAQGLNAQLKAQQNASNQAMFGNLLGSAGAAGILAFSDENLKTEIKDGSRSIRSFLDSLNASEYKYKSEAFGEKGTHTSVMAQELEKSEIGKKMVKETPVGKVVDYSKGLPAMLAAQADLNKRLKVIEEKDQKPGIQKFHKGGKVQKMAAGGYVPQDPGARDPNFVKNFLSSLQQLSTPQGANAGMSKMGDALGTVIGQKLAGMGGPTTPMPGLGGGANMAAMPMPSMMNEGGYVVPGKAKVEGDSEDNDTVPAILSPGEIVIPRSVAKKSPQDIAKFVAAIQKKEKKNEE